MGRETPDHRYERNPSPKYQVRKRIVKKPHEGAFLLEWSYRNVTASSVSGDDGVPAMRNDGFQEGFRRISKIRNGEKNEYGSPVGSFGREDFAPFGEG